ncbi:MAG TPA: hypothetical protein VMD30_06350 [Tepidisphaeraceae bacterium]|nr:hypothetical protein [Tepidisphaeraceae bacterium]
MQVLPYGRADRPRRRHKAFRIIAIIAIVIFLFNEVPPFVDRLQLLYWQHECMVFTAPPNVVVWQSNNPLLPKPAMPPGYVDPLYLGGNNVARMPRCMVKFLEATQSLRPPFSVILPAGAIFIHERKSRSGLRRLVMVEVLEQGGWTFAVNYQAVSPGTLSTDPVYWPDTSKPVPPVTSAPPPCIFFAGQIDPNDSSHFTIGYEWDDGVRRVMDGYLGDDGNVHLSYKDADLESELKRLHVEH